jgi:uncharacterized protein with PQ loop repeat
MSYELRHTIKRNASNAPTESSFLKRTLDKIAYPVALIVPLSSLDQALSIWQEKSAVGVSIVLWVMLFMTSSFWIFYGIIHRERVILFGHLALVCISGLIIFEIILFS